LQSGDLDKASRLLLDAIAHSPNDGGLVNLRGILHAKRNELAEAQVDFESAVRLNPALTPAWRNLGRACRQTGNVPCAIQAWQHVQRGKPADSEAHESLALLFFFGTDTSTGRAKVVQRSRFNFFREAQIWYSRDLDQCPLSEQFENLIVLSDEFYREISAHAIPADLEAVKVLAGAPAVLDLFMWLSYRCFLAKGQEAIPLLGTFGLAGQIGSIEYARPRRFREKLDQWLHIIHGLWPECPARISSDGESLIVDRANAVLTEQKIGRQGENQKNDPIVAA